MEVKIAPKGTKIPTKQCTCCKMVHEVLPRDGKMTSVGLWFDCDCESTLLLSTKKYGLCL